MTKLDKLGLEEAGSEKIIKLASEKGPVKPLQRLGICQPVNGQKFAV